GVRREGRRRLHPQRPAPGPRRQLDPPMLRPAGRDVRAHRAGKLISVRPGKTLGLPFPLAAKQAGGSQASAARSARPSLITAVSVERYASIIAGRAVTA